MNFKKPKQRVLDEAWIAAENMIRHTLRAQIPYGPTMNHDNMINMVTIAVAGGIREALMVVVDNIYTDAEFEEDIGLRDKT